NGHGAVDPPPGRSRAHPGGRADPVLHLDPANLFHPRIEIAGRRHPEILQFLKRATIGKYRRQVFRKVLEEIFGILSKPKISVWIILAPIGRWQQCWLSIIIENAEIGFSWYCYVGDVYVQGRHCFPDPSREEWKPESVTKDQNRFLHHSLLA